MDSDKCLDYIKQQSIQTIYLDPPYNTKSKNFEYFDDYDDWVAFMQPKLKKAYQLLQETGVLFISIDDNKLIELCTICNKIFGKNNFIGIFITRQATRSNARHINTIHEYVIVFARNKKKAPKFEISRLDIPFYADKLQPLMNEIKKEFKRNGRLSASELLNMRLKDFDNDEHFSFLKNYSIVDEKGEICFATDLSVPSKNPKELYIEEIMLHLPALPSRGWSSKEKFIQLFNENKLIFKNGRPYEKHLLRESKDNAMSILNFYSRQGKHDLQKLDLGDIFSTAKPVEMIKYFIKISQISQSDEILDFFAGSGTTAQAVLECNQEDEGKRKFILCQTNEPINPKSKAMKYFNYSSPTIADITVLRLEKLKEKYSFQYHVIYNMED